MYLSSAHARAVIVCELAKASLRARCCSIGANLLLSCCVYSPPPWLDNAIDVLSKTDEGEFTHVSVVAWPVLLFQLRVVY
jgi:hypothetical protein